MTRFSGALIASLLVVAGCSKDKKDTSTPPTATGGPTTGIPGEYEEPTAGTPTYDENGVEPTPQAGTGKEIDATEIRDRLDDVFAALNARDPERVRQLYADDAEVVIVDSGMSFKGGTDVTTNLYQSGMWTPFPDLKLDPQLTLVNGKNVIAIVRTSGTNTGDFGMAGQQQGQGQGQGQGQAMQKATGKGIAFLCVYHFVFDDEGKITRELHVGDPLTVMSQLGLITIPTRTMNDANLPEVDRRTIVAADSQTEMENVARVKQFEEDILGGKVDAAMASLADGIVLSDQSMGKDTLGKPDLQKELTGFTKSFGNIKTRSHVLLPAGDYVASIMEYTMVNTGDLPEMNVKATGRVIKLTDYSVYHLSNGKIDRVYMFRNGLAFAEQLGVDLQAPAGGDDMKGQPQDKDKADKNKGKKNKKQQK
jgi:predicted ester cyclase